MPELFIRAVKLAYFLNSALALSLPSPTPNVFSGAAFEELLLPASDGCAQEGSTVSSQQVANIQPVLLPPANNTFAHKALSSLVHN